METILITGASSGIGREIAVLLSNHYRLVLNGRDAIRLEETKSLCSNSNDHIIWLFDLSDIDNLESAYTAFSKENSLEINHMIYCAGIIKTYPLKMVSPVTLREVFNINVFAGELLAKVLTNARINHGHLRSIVYISSNISGFGAKAHSVYGASKAAVDGMMQSLAVELAPAVRVNSVLPGGVRTPMTEHIYENQEVIARMEASYPLGLGQTLDIANAVKFLISNDARWITGQQLYVDGGRTVNITG